MRTTAIIAALLGASFLAGCGDGPGEPPADPFACIQGWPPESNATLASPLAVTPAVVWTQTLGDGESLPIVQSHVMTQTGANLVLALAQGTEAFDRTTGQRLWTAQPITHESTTSFSQPALVAGRDGNLYGLARDTYSLDASGAPRWNMPADFFVDSGGEFHLVTRSPPVLSPDGLLFVQDGDSVSALRTGDGSEAWHQKGAVPLLGAGPVLVFESDVRTAADGQLLGQVRAKDGSRLRVWLVAGFGFLGWPRSAESLEAIDPCDQVLWSLPSGSSTTLFVEAIGPTGLAYVVRTPRNGGGAEHTLMTVSPAGTVLATTTTAGWVVAVGSDGTAYLEDCSSDSVVEIIALDDGLRELWRLPIEGVCPEDVMLGEGGLLYVLNFQYPSERLTAIQTTSPGLAPTGWPTVGHDARSTRWLGP
jgi:outer membrane protein assembly factor BamB